MTKRKNRRCCLIKILLYYNYWTASGVRVAADGILLSLLRFDNDNNINIVERGYRGKTVEACYYYTHI